MVDVGLIVYLTAWYLGNYYYNIFNKTAAKAGGGSEYAMIMAWIQMAVGAVYALALCVCLPAPGPSLSPSCGSASWPHRGLSGVGPTGAAPPTLALRWILPEARKAPAITFTQVMYWPSGTSNAGCSSPPACPNCLDEPSEYSNTTASTRANQKFSE